MGVKSQTHKQIKTVALFIYLFGNKSFFLLARGIKEGKKEKTREGRRAISYAKMYIVQKLLLVLEIDGEMGGRGL